VPSKNTGVYAVFAMLQDVVSICGKDKNTIFSDVFASGRSKQIVRKLLKNGQNQLPKASYNFGIFFPGPGPPKT